MLTTFRVETADGMAYVGEIRGGFIEIDGMRAPAQNVVAARVESDNMSGYFELRDGTRLGFHERKLQGIFGPHGIFGGGGRTNLSGEILIYVESIGKEIAVPAIHVRFIAVHLRPFEPSRPPGRQPETQE